MNNPNPYPPHRGNLVIAEMTLVCATDDSLQDHAGGNHSEKTLEWHGTALGLMRSSEMTLVQAI